MNKIHIEKFKKEDTKEIVSIVFDSFVTKFNNIVSIPYSKLKELFYDTWNLNTHLATDGHFIAKKDNKVIGVILLNYKNQKILNLKITSKKNITKMIHNYGFINIIKFLFALSLLSSNKTSPNECYIEHVAVSKKFRGIGIGSLLIEYGESFIKQFPSVNTYSLHVAKSNIKAFKLYKDLGFIENKSKDKKSILLNYLTGEKHFIYMQKKIM